MRKKKDFLLEINKLSKLPIVGDGDFCNPSKNQPMDCEPSSDEPDCNPSLQTP